MASTMRPSATTRPPIAAGSNQRLRELLLPLLLLPMVVPVLVPCIEATAVVLRQDPLEQLLPLLRLTAAYDAVFIALALVLFDFVVEE